MGRLRALTRTWRWLALVLVIASLAARLAIPAGFMPVRDGSRVAIVPCSGFGPMAMAMPGHREHAPAGQHDDQPCGFGALAQPTLGGADLPLLLAAIVIAMAAARMRPPIPGFVRAFRLRPPLRAPPV